MPRERRPPKRFRTSTDSDRDQDSGRGLSQPLSPTTKRQKRTPSQALSSVIPPKPKEENITICNPFDDSPASNFSVFPKMNPQRLGPYTNINSFQQPTQPNYTGVDNGSLQSLMFHPNMNRQSSYPCGMCQQEVQDTDTAIMCEGGCDFWYHKRCTGLTEFAYNLLRKEELAVWCCDNCIRQKKIPMVMLKPQPVS
ncbi:uncharacterized protein [Antedon mediterranea]|uniref:uncharacterized protein n=1 Tax=Antedon mediterranea TaxID=105859 RepID=UPI003AF51825